MRKVPTQAQRVFKYINDFGSITRVEAMTDIGVANLTAVISILRNQGHDIETVNVHTKNRYGQKITYAKYMFGKERKVN